MSAKSKLVSGMISLLLILAVAHVYLGVAFAAPIGEGDEAGKGQPQQASGILTTTESKPITVNGISTPGGATIMSGATLETPVGISATVTIAALGSLSIEPGAKVILVFDQPGVVKVNVSQGCVALQTNKNITGEIYSPSGAVTRTDPRQDGGSARACAGGAVATAALSSGRGGLFGLGTAATIAIIAGGAAAIILPLTLGRGSNPSPATP